MADSEKQPLVFANQAVRQFADQTLGDQELRDDDFTVIRTVFRRHGGSWENVASGDPGHVDLLRRIVKAWGKLQDA